MASVTGIADPSEKVSDVVIHDHKELKDYYDKILSATDGDTKTRWQNQFCWELARHSIAEELVVYPALEKNLGAMGKEKAEKDRAQHQDVNLLIHPLIFPPLTSPILTSSPLLTSPS